MDTGSSSASPPNNHNSNVCNSSSRRRESFSSYPHGCWLLVSFLLLPVSVSFIFYRLDPSDPAAYPELLPASKSQASPRVILRGVLQSSDLVASGQVVGPEDIVYDQVNGWLYTGCEDGWIKRVEVNVSGYASTVVEELVNTGGRPLGLALGRVGGNGHSELFIADGNKGLLKLTNNKELVLLSKEAEGKEFKLTDGVDVARDGTIYFTDASFKYGYKDSTIDNLEGRPHGRLLSFEPSTRETRVLLRDLYFPNGVAVSPDQSSVIFCETALRRCSRYHIKGSKVGKRDPFVDYLPGSPDNIHYDGEGLYWVAIYTSLPSPLYKLLEYPSVRKALIIIEKYIGLRSIQKNAGILAVDLEGNLVARFSDTRLSAITSAVKIGQHLYCGSLYNTHILRLNITQSPI